MSRRPFVKSILKLAALCLMLGGLLILLPGQKVEADDVSFSCIQQYSFCVMGCPPPPPDGSLDACRAQCELNNNSCTSCEFTGLPIGCEGGTDALPQRWPVIDRSRSICLQGCQQGCSGIADPAERLACYTPCWEFCNATYPKF